jgi:hypothetical protein
MNIETPLVDILDIPTDNIENSSDVNMEEV